MQRRQNIHRYSHCIRFGQSCFRRGIFGPTGHLSVLSLKSRCLNQHRPASASGHKSLPRTKTVHQRPGLCENRPIKQLFRPASGSVAQRAPRAHHPVAAASTLTFSENTDTFHGLHSGRRYVSGGRSEGRSQCGPRRRCGTVDVDRDFCSFVIVWREDHQKWVSETCVMFSEVIFKRYFTF